MSGVFQAGAVQHEILGDGRPRQAHVPRSATAKQAFGHLLNGRTLRPNQITFFDMLINHLTEHWAMSADRLYAFPYADLNPRSVEGLCHPSRNGRDLRQRRLRRTQVTDRPGRVDVQTRAEYAAGLPKRS